MGLALKGKAECNKKHQRNGEVFQIVSHWSSLGKVVCMDDPTWVEDAIGGEKFRSVVFLVSRFCLMDAPVNFDVRMN